MFNRKFMLAAVFLVGLLAISAVSATDSNETDDVVSAVDVDDNLEISKEDMLSATHKVSGNTFEDVQNTIDGASEGDTIIISGDCSGNGKEIDVNKRVTIVGENNACLDAKLSSRIFNISQDNVAIKNLKIINGNSNVWGGGAIDVGYQYDDLNGFYYYHLYCFNCSFLNNHAENGAGAISASGEGSAVYDCTFVNNSAGNAGAISLADAFNCSFVNNYASSSYIYPASSGAMFGGDATNCTFVNNSAGKAGAINSGRAIGCTFVNNSATGGDGGAIHESYEVVNCTFISNSANGAGGAIYCYEQGNLNISDSKFLNNNANDGGAIWLHYYCYYANITNCRFENNNAVNGAGAIHVGGDRSAVYDCTFVNNSVNEQFGIAVEWSGDYGILKNSTFSSMKNPLSFNSDNGEVYKCSFVNNSGTIVRWDVSGKGSLQDCEFINNSAIDLVYVKNWIFSSVSEYNNFTVKNSIINNSYGGAVNIQNNILTIINSVSKGNITVKISDKKFIESANSTETRFNLNSLKSGTYYANIYFSGDGEYEASEMNIPITIVSNYKVTASDVTKYYGGSEKWVISLSENGNALANKNVNVTLNDKTSTVKTDSKGQANVDLNLGVGNYTVTATYGDASITSKISVKSTLTVSDASGTYLNSKVSATFLDANGKALVSKPVTFKVGSKSYSATTGANGVASANIDLGVGTYNVTAVNQVNSEQKTFKLVISKAKSAISLVSSQSNGVTTLTATLNPSAASGNVIFNVNGNEQSVAVNSGKAVLTLINPDAGNYTATAAYNGDNNLNASTSNTVTFSVAEVYPILTAKQVTKTYGTATKLVVYLKDNKGNAIANTYVKVVLNKVTKSIKTNSKGQATLAITNVPGSYTAKITYGTAQTTAKITVKKASPKIIASKKTYKVNLKTKKYTIMLKANGKAMKSTKVYIKVNKKTFTATTNSKGQATFKITNLKKKGTFSATVTYKATKCYNKATKTVKITTKK